MFVDNLTGGEEGNCRGSTAYESQNQEVFAPIAGKILYGSENDFVCVSSDKENRSFYIGHLINRTPQGPIGRGEKIGEVAQPNSGNGNYAHIHVQVHPVVACPKGNLVPFIGDMAFEGVGDLAYDGSPNQHTGKKLTRGPLPYPIGSLIRLQGTGDGRAVYLVAVDDSGNIVKRWVKDEATFALNNLHFADVHDVEQSVLSFYTRGVDITAKITTDGLTEGELVWLNGGGAVFVVSDGMLFVFDKNSIFLHDRVKMQNSPETISSIIRNWQRTKTLIFHFNHATKSMGKVRNHYETSVHHCRNHCFTPCRRGFFGLEKNWKSAGNEYPKSAGKSESHTTYDSGVANTNFTERPNAKRKFNAAETSNFKNPC